MSLNSQLRTDKILEVANRSFSKGDLTPRGKRMTAADVSHVSPRVLANTLRSQLPRDIRLSRV